MKHYSGRREGYAVIVTVDGRRLNPRLDLWNHSPTGFERGCGGSGPAQLALAILADHCANKERALNWCQRFKWAVIGESLCSTKKSRYRIQDPALRFWFQIYYRVVPGPVSIP